jgi:hypothetical protein
VYEDGESFRISDYSVDEDHPMRLVHCLQTTGAGCQWMLDQWADLRALLERGVPWLAPDKLKAVRLLGHHPIDALDSEDVAMVYLASHMLLNQEGQPFQEILNELPPNEAPQYEKYLKARNYDARGPEDAAAAREMLLQIIEKATEVLEEKADVFHERDEIDAGSASDRLSWDDTEEGERLRRYEMTCERTWYRLLDLLMKIRSTGQPLDLGTSVPLRRFNQPVNCGATAASELSVAIVDIPPVEALQQPEPPIEAKSEPENAPNEPNSSVPAPSSERVEGHKAVRIDTPHRECKVSGGGIIGKPRFHPALVDRLETGRQSPLLNLSPIFGKQ